MSDPKKFDKLFTALMPATADETIANPEVMMQKMSMIGIMDSIEKIITGVKNELYRNPGTGKSNMNMNVVQIYTAAINAYMMLFQDVAVNYEKNMAELLKNNETVISTSSADEDLKFMEELLLKKRPGTGNSGSSNN